ncbi:unnamed protein product [Calypogeia fissa]
MSLPVKVPMTFSHPEISEELASETSSSAGASQSDFSPGIPPEIVVSDAPRLTFTHPEISAELGVDGPSSVPATESAIIMSPDARPEHIVIDPASAVFSHPEISQEVPSTETAPSATSTLPAETMLASSFSHPEISQEILPTNAFTEASVTSIQQVETSAEVVPESSGVAGATPPPAFCDPILVRGVQQGDTSADADLMPGPLAELSKKDDTANSELVSQPEPALTKNVHKEETSLEIRPQAAEPFASSNFTTITQPQTPAEVPTAYPLLATLSKEVSSEISAARSTVGSDPGSDYEVRSEISRDDPKAIVDALTRKTLSQDAVFEPIFEGERKYVSETAPRKTITDHSKDAEAITSVEREGLTDIATRRTMIQPDIALSPFQQPLEISPVWYNNPVSDNKMSDIEKAAYVATAVKPKVKLYETASAKVEPLFEISEEVVPQKSKLALLKLDREAQPEVSAEEDSIDSRDKGKMLKDASMELIPEELKDEGETSAKETDSYASTDGSPPEAERRKVGFLEDTPASAPGFPKDKALTPFSKKERRELVRSISMRIIEPEAPLWDMDLADIQEAEEAEKKRNASRPTFEPSFDFDEPIKPKAPVRRSKRHRTVRVHATDYAHTQAVESQEFCTNKIKSTKYTVVTFLPMNLFLQCSRAANLYFILIAALQLIPDFSPTNWATTVAPLCFVLFFNAAKEFIDEIKRSISDRTINKQKVEVLNENNFLVTNWSSVIVGDIVRVKSEQEFPADLVFLSSADVKGLAYVETANLDGETNLKIRNAFYKGSSTVEDDESPYKNLSGLTIECELPNNRLYKFEGAINLQDYGKLPLDTRQVLLRGATLRNTEWILGVVVYTGADTKFIRNMIPGQVKVTELERNMNILVAIVFVCQVALCVGLAAANDQWTRDEDNFSNYIPDFQEIQDHIGPKLHTIGAQFGRFLILLNQLIPISLYVTLEIVKVVQSYYIDWDVHMYHRDTKTFAKARTTNLNEELGQVQYVMADKTGTLTQNIMAFVQCSVGGVVYGAIQHEGGFHVGVQKDTIHTLANDPKLIEKLKEVEAGSQDIDSEYLAAFFIHLAICHVVHPMFAKKGEGFEEDAVLKYTGASPDEEALVQGAADCGYVLKKRADDELSVLLPGAGVERFVIMAVLEFTSERKRMSIICRDSKGRIKLYCKGADSVIFKRLARGQEELVDISLNQLEDFARCGYRTMCMAERQISGSEYEKWAARFRAASIALDDRDEKLAAVSETIERDLMLLGVTAVEDKLQGKVPETITLLAQAGIKVWVLTGDKLETSVSVALSCNLLADSMHLFLLSDNVSKSVPQLLRSMLDEARRQHYSKLKSEGSGYQSEMATVIEGSSLTVALEENNKVLFLELLKLCRSVVCCRVSPIQKAQVTMLLKDHGNSVILAIGDGANDCGMIKAAQIGVGIGGREGMAAVLASDYSVTRFRYLRRLLLVHGRWSYKRNRELVMYAFYKNIVYALGNLYLAFYTGFSSQALYNAVEIATFNLERRPQFFWSLTGWALSAFWDSLIAFFLPLAAAFASGKSGDTLDIWELGSTVYTMAVFIVNVKMISRMHNFTWFHFAAFNISTWIWLLVLFCLSYSWKLCGFFPDLAGVGKVVTQSSFFWLLLVLCPVVSILPYWTLEVFRNLQAPADFEVMREIEHGWTDGYYFPDAPDYVEQITAPIPERRTSLLESSEDYGPSPMQNVIADAKGAVAVEGGDSSKFSGILGSTDSTGPGNPVTVQAAKGKFGDKPLRPRRLTWREVVNDDELEDLATSESLGRDGRRRSSGFQVVTRHTDTAEVPVVPIAQGPTPPQRKSIMFEQSAPLASVAPTTVATRRASLKPPPETPPQHQKKEEKKHEQKLKSPTKTRRPEDTRLKAVRANLAKHAEERKLLVPGPGTSSPKEKVQRTTKKGKDIWAALKEGTAERDPYAAPQDSPHPLQKMQAPGSSSRTTTPRTPRAGSPVPQSPRAAAKPRRFDPTTKQRAHSPGAPHTPRAGPSNLGPGTPRPPKLSNPTPSSKDPKTGPGHSS